MPDSDRRLARPRQTRADRLPELDRPSTVRSDAARQCAVSDFAPGERRIVTVGGRSIGVFHIGDRFYGIRNRCPHQGGPLCVGHIHDDAVADAPGAAQIARNPTRIACPWHGWEYDLATGQSFLGGAEPGVKSYGVALEPGRSLVAQLDDAQIKPVPGPYTAETFQVTVQDDYVVLEV